MNPIKRQAILADVFILNMRSHVEFGTPVEIRSVDCRSLCRHATLLVGKGVDSDTQ